MKKKCHHTCEVEKKENRESSVLCYLTVLNFFNLTRSAFIYIFKAILNTEPVLTQNTAHRSLCDVCRHRQCWKVSFVLSAITSSRRVMNVYWLLCHLRWHCAVWLDIKIWLLLLDFKLIATRVYAYCLCFSLGSGMFDDGQGHGRRCNFSFTKKKLNLTLYRCSAVTFLEYKFSFKIRIIILHSP